MGSGWIRLLGGRLTSSRGVERVKTMCSPGFYHGIGYFGDKEWIYPTWNRLNGQVSVRRADDGYDSTDRFFAADNEGVDEQWLSRLARPSPMMRATDAGGLRALLQRLWPVCSFWEVASGCCNLRQVALRPWMALRLRPRKGPADLGLCG